MLFIGWFIHKIGIYNLDSINFQLLEYVQRELTEKDKIETMQFNLLVATGTYYFNLLF